MKRIYELLDKRRTSARTFGEDAELQAAVVDLDQKRIRKLFESILREGSPFDDLILYTLFSTWGEIAPRDALLAIERLPTNHRKWARKATLKAWVLFDTDAAFDYVNLGKPTPKTNFVSESRDQALWHQLADVYPERALERAAKIEDPEESRKREDEILRIYAHAAPHKALDWLLTNREGGDQAEALKGIIRGWASSKPDEAFEYVLTLDQGKQTAELFEGLGHSTSRGHEMASELLAKVPDRFRDAYWGGYVERTATFDPAQAAILSMGLEDGQAKRSAYERIATEWSFKDPIALSEWIASLPRSRSRDAAISSLAHSLNLTDPEASVRWYADMDFEGDNSPFLNNALADWLRRDEAAATTWIDAQGTDRVSQRLRERVLAEHAAEKLL